MTDTENVFILEEECEDLQLGLELTVLDAWREYPELLDLEVRDALNALVLHYQAGTWGGKLPALPTATGTLAVYGPLFTLCELTQGRGGLAPYTITSEELLSGLRQWRESVGMVSEVEDDGTGRAYLSMLRSLHEL